MNILGYFIFKIIKNWNDHKNNPKICIFVFNILIIYLITRLPILLLLLLLLLLIVILNLIYCRNKYFKINRNKREKEEKYIFENCYCLKLLSLK